METFQPPQGNPVITDSVLHPSVDDQAMAKGFVEDARFLALESHHNNWDKRGKGETRRLLDVDDIKVNAHSYPNQYFSEENIASHGSVQIIPSDSKSREKYGTKKHEPVAERSYDAAIFPRMVDQGESDVMPARNIERVHYGDTEVERWAKFDESGNMSIIQEVIRRNPEGRIVRRERMWANHGRVISHISQDEDDWRRVTPRITEAMIARTADLSSPDELTRHKAQDRFARRSLGIENAKKHAAELNRQGISTDSRKRG